MAEDRVYAEMIKDPDVKRYFSIESWKQQVNRGIWRAVEGQSEALAAATPNAVAGAVGRKPAPKANDKVIQEMAAHARLNDEVKSEPPASEFVNPVAPSAETTAFLHGGEPPAPLSDSTPAETPAKPKRKYTKRQPTA